jgi:hypothetical protein
VAAVEKLGLVFLLGPVRYLWLLITRFRAVGQSIQLTFLARLIEIETQLVHCGTRPSAQEKPAQKQSFAPSPQKI